MYGPTYAQHYDCFYSHKDYDAECDLVEAAFAQYASQRCEAILDLGCGTGSHAICLCRRGFRVTGVDRSPNMLCSARKKAASGPRLENGSSLEFVEGDLRHVTLDKTFDAVLMMFAVLGYQLRNEDVLAALSTARRHLRRGGLFLFDVWYGPAVLAQRPSTQVKEFNLPEGKVIRSASATLDTAKHTALVRISTWQLTVPLPGAESVEMHETRFFFPQELALFLESTDFELVSISAFPHLDVPANDANWNAFVVARAR